MRTRGGGRWWWRRGGAAGGCCQRMWVRGGGAARKRPNTPGAVIMCASIARGLRALPLSVGRPRGRCPRRPEDGGEADGAEAEHGAGGARLDAGGVERGADPGGDAAAQQAGHVEGCGRVDLGEGDVGHHDVLAWRRAERITAMRGIELQESRRRN